jgi:hypothetical protein
MFLIGGFFAHTGFPPNLLQSLENPLCTRSSQALLAPAPIAQAATPTKGGSRALPKAWQWAYLEELFLLLGGFTAKPRPVRFHIEE